MNPKVDEFIAKHSQWTDALVLLRELMLSLNMEETLKWGAPVYMAHGKNVLSLGAFKNHFGIWFFNGVFLKDTHKILETAQETTKAMRSVKYFEIDQLNIEVLKKYVEQAIDIEKKGLKVSKAEHAKYEMPELLKTAMDADGNLLDAFNKLTPGRQKEYANYISSAKQETTKQSRLDKIIPMILAGGGLNDKYANC
ncbi:MAG: YdeI/OmpD-associated family protein [Flavobacteriales bacterium]|nr:YdeI/OmpD-associated family protein [Flavobacteriales bacterium]